MFAGSLILAATLISVAAWLQWNEVSGWGDRGQSQTELDERYHRQRSRSRTRTNIIIALCGVCILVAAFIGPGPVWIAAWLSVTVGLATVVGLAGLDVLRTHRYQLAKLQEIGDRRQVDKQKSA
ncbi:hypothetical protein Poly51_56390 [Rubripirellula tenax]|uniref:Uncharacterized protein n=1 Tax=Rubripirellula tenax TaxID=2528015 RepID=A0A5C6E9B1_9BACT|nr:hypothetical protein [Rubripirellula tenax]TWU46243.1 hypothetical protein Poly51_56390 [Rubripirellula tenax]